MKKILTLLLALAMVCTMLFSAAFAEEEKPLIILLMAKSTSPYSGTYMTYFVENANTMDRV